MIYAVFLGVLKIAQLAERHKAHLGHDLAQNGLDLGELMGIARCHDDGRRRVEGVDVDLLKCHEWSPCLYSNAAPRAMFITGSAGTGKSYLATAFGFQACQKGYKVLYANTSRLMGMLKVAKAKGTILQELKKIERLDMLILDDFGIQPFDSQGRMNLMDIIEDRHGKKSTIITSQVPVKDWYDVIGEKTIADAVLDRIVHQAIRIELFGESLRKCKSKK